MDSAPQHANVPSAPVGPAGNSPWRYAAVMYRVSSVVLAGILGGGVIAAVLWFYPYSRVVVKNQPVSTAIKVHSARLEKDGYIVLYANTKTGSQIVGLSTRLRAGYYRDFVIPLARETVYPDRVREFVVRIFVDDGDLAFDEVIDTPVMTARGTVYQKRFWFLYPERLPLQWYRAFISEPLSMLGDMIIP